MKTYSLRKSKKILIAVYHLLKRKKKRLLPAQVQEIQNDLKNLQEEILKKNEEGASYLAHKCQDYGMGILKKRGWEQLRDLVFALVFALVVALLIRQVWFELYEIPTGSMRPTLKEKDRLIVSKTTFGINVPFTTDHLYFNPDLVKRSGIFVFSAENMDVHDPDTLYFFVFPGKKQLVKRMMGRPGDSLYFYGGRIYGIDKDGKDISTELQLPCLDKIDHIPFMFFGGDVSVSEPFLSNRGNAYRMSIIHQMNVPVARLTVLSNKRFEGEMLYTPRIHNRSAPPVRNYYELWGFENYATARILRKSEARALASRHDVSLEEGEHFLELAHHPDLKHIELGKDWYGRLRPEFILSRSLVPLDDSHLRKIFNTLFTARFVVKNGFMMPYSLEKNPYIATHNLTRLEGVPDGTYEFYYGKAYKIISPPWPLWGGITKKLPSDHVLQQYSPQRTRKLFNYGVVFNKPYAFNTDSGTKRYGYFREGDLYVLGAPIFKQGDSVLKTFVAREEERELAANPQNPYHPFIDRGPPLQADGTIDKAKILQYGLLIPPNSYLALGDNNSNSADSRDFGFVPEGNLKGSPSFIFWPPSHRFGPPNQPPNPWVTLPNLIVWFIAAICLGLWYASYRRNHKLPLKLDL
ncbi:MAG: Signal peptidase IB [Chlamydiae bacterium]|nr:Signal peptidase IB [Chlamydiota bacterium]